MAVATLSPRSMRPFITIWIGQLISQLGSGLTSFALAVWIFNKTGKVTPFAITVLLSTLPSLLLTPLAGSLADRWNRKLLMLLSDAGAALMTLIIFLLVDQLSIGIIYAAVAISDCMRAFQEPAWTASITMLVPKEQLTRASALGQLSNALEGLITPVLAGLLFVSIGLRGILLIDFITFFFALGTMLIIPIAQPRAVIEDGKSKSNWWGDALFGWRYLYQRQGLFGLLLFFGVVNFCLNLSAVILGPMVLSMYTAREYGFVQMAFGLGTLLGSLTMSGWGGPKGKKIPWIFGFIALSGCGMAIAGSRPVLIIIMFGVALVLFGVPFGSGLSQAIFQRKVEPGAQGRVFAARVLLSRSLMPLAFLLSGPLADKIFNPLMQPDSSLGAGWVGAWLGTGPGRGIGLMMVLSAVLLLVSCILAYANPRIRNLEAEIPDAGAQE